MVSLNLSNFITIGLIFFVVAIVLTLIERRLKINIPFIGS